ncbi:MAG: PAS domain-containing protein, partial [Halobacteriales archaeon]|nr:PAS domain-containing protein [Halobacteriales archaeon]
LRREKRLSERIVQSLPIGLVVHDRNGDVILTNDRANEILGTTQAELNADEYESGSWKLRDADGEPVSYDRLPFTRVAAGEDLRDEPYTVLTRDGDVKQTVVSGARIRDEDDELTAVIIPFRVVGEE